MLACSTLIAQPVRQLSMTGAVLQVNDGALTSEEVLKSVIDQLRPLAQENDLQTYAQKALPIISQATMAHLRDLVLYQYALKQFSRNEGFDNAIKGAVDSQSKVLIADHGGSEALAQEDFAREGTTLEEQLKIFKQDFIVMSYQQIYFLPAQEITRSQMLQYYRTHQSDEFALEAEIQFQLIDIPADTADAKNTAAQALEQLKQGTDFAEVVRKFSQGIYKDNAGIWRPLKPESLREEYRPIVTALEDKTVGDFTDIIEATGHYFIAKLLKRQQAAVRSFPEVQSEIKEKIQRQRWMKYREKLQSELAQNAIIGNIELFVQQTILSGYDMIKNR